MLDNEKTWQRQQENRSFTFEGISQNTGHDSLLFVRTMVFDIQEQGVPERTENVLGGRFLSVDMHARGGGKGLRFNSGDDLVKRDGFRESVAVIYHRFIILTVVAIH